MSAFDDLPPTARSLLVAKANLEILTAGCLNILELAHKRNQTVNEVWHDICFKSGQPICPLPPRMLQSDYSAAKPIPAASASDTAFADGAIAVSDALAAGMGLAAE